MAGLWEGCLRGDLRLVKKHLDRGVDVNYHRGGISCLMAAVKEGQNYEIISLLLQQPEIDVNAQGNTGRRALHMAAGCRGTPAILRLLLDFPGIDQEAEVAPYSYVSTAGKTPLMYSIAYGTTAEFAENVCSGAEEKRK